MDTFVLSFIIRIEFGLITIEYSLHEAGLLFADYNDYCKTPKIS